MAKKAARPKSVTKRLGMAGPGPAGPGPAGKGGKQAAKRLAKPRKATALLQSGIAAKAGRKAAVKPLIPLNATSGILAPPAFGVARPSDASRSEVLDRLWAVVMARREADPAVSHSARLLSRGTAKVAQKFGEEAVECLIEAMAGNRAALVAESADVLYHLLVMWVDAAVRPVDVWTELERREGVSGIAEKASRRLGRPTTKIP